MAKKIYILDTSACLTDANCIRSYGNNDIVLPLKVLEEIDNNKKRQDGVGLPEQRYHGQRDPPHKERVLSHRV